MQAAAPAEAERLDRLRLRRRLQGLSKAETVPPLALPSHPELVAAGGLLNDRREARAADALILEVVRQGYVVKCHVLASRRASGQARLHAADVGQLLRLRRCECAGD